jgi:hypothetical protein
MKQIKISTFSSTFCIVLWTESNSAFLATCLCSVKQAARDGAELEPATQGNFAASEKAPFVANFWILTWISRTSLRAYSLESAHHLKNVTSH